jgi:hypothetical protein
VAANAGNQPLWREAVAGVELARLGAGDHQLDVRAADIDDQDAHGSKDN